MSIKETCLIPEIFIKDFKNNSPGLSVISLNELFDKFSAVVTKPHRICYYQLLLLEEGNGCLHIDSKKYNFRPRSVFAQSKGSVEYFDHNRKRDYLKSGNVGHAILFTDEYLYKYPEDLLWLNRLKLFDISADPLLKLSDSEFTELNHFLKKIINESNSQKNFASDEILINMLKTFLLVIERIKRTRTCEESSNLKENTVLLKFKEKLEENFFLSRSVRSYADILNVTPKKLNQVTQTYMGNPAKKVIEERVLLEIKRLLIYTDKTVREIGFSMGFNDPTNFNKFFKRYTKVTPAEFRASYNK